MGQGRVEKAVTILTDGEKVEGVLSHLDGIRLSDFLNAPMHQEAPFLIVLNAQVTCRRSGEELAKTPFMLIARNRVAMIMTPTDEIR